jgi:hypothetical protein
VSEPQVPPALEWSGWVGITEAASRKGPFAHFGVYQIRLVDSTGVPIPIPRLIKVDPSGTMYIGRSGFGRQGTARFVCNRIREFVSRQHSGGQTYFIASIAMLAQPSLASHALQVRAWSLVDDEIEQAEDFSLTQYLMEYGELPPCNSVMPNLKRVLF